MMDTTYQMTIYFAYFLAVSNCMRGLSAQEHVVTYSSKEMEELECPMVNADVVQWANVEGGSLLCAYLKSTGNATRETSDPKYTNFDCNVTPTNFDLIIREVDKDDGGGYRCSRIAGGPLTYTLTVEVTPLNVDIDNNGNEFVNVNEIYSFTCTAVGVRSPNILNLTWSTNNVREVVVPERSESTPGSDLQDLTSTFELSPQKDDAFIRCGITGYVNQDEINEDIITDTIHLKVHYEPICTLEFGKDEVGETGCTVTLTCDCDANPEVTAGGYSFFKDNSLINGDSDTTTGDVQLDTTAEFSCRGRNIVGSGDQSPAVEYTCLSTITFSTATPDAKTGDDRTQKSSAALIAICCIEGVVIIAMMFVFFFLYTIRKGSRKEEAHSGATHPFDATDKTNTAYMELQETKQLSSSHVNVDIPFENLNLQAPFPGRGLVKYRKAEMTFTSNMEKIVVKSVSDDAPVSLAKLQADEARNLATLTSNANVAQFLGRCNNVPNLLCYQYVNGTKLGEYLRENFQPSKIHQYGNTKQKRYHVPEKGPVESLPRVALQVARGMNYLTAQKFLHPGLRSGKVIIDLSGQCKLYDFVSEDNAKDIIAILWSKSVPYQWMPPEYLFLEKLSPSGDVWSFGILIWEIFSYGAVPHEGKGRDDVEKELRGKETLPLPNNCPGAIWQITLNCWDQSPEKRPSFDHLSLQLSHMCNGNKEYDEIQSK